MTAKTSRIVIKTFIKTALKDSDESPERCTRNLVDMALNFANGRFQQSFFEISRAMLNNENSPYYPLIEDILKHMDKEKLIDFGLNIGYIRNVSFFCSCKDTTSISFPSTAISSFPESDLAASSSCADAAKSSAPSTALI